MLPDGLAAVSLNPGVIDTAMLRQCWAKEAAAYEDPRHLVPASPPFVLALGPEDNGSATTVP